MQSKYGYDEATRREIEHMIRLAIPAPIRLKTADLPADFGGVDLRYTVNGTCDLQVRSRFNRPIWAADSDVTLRTTEPPMIARGTYAPMMLFTWFRDGYAKAGKLVDVYRMAERVDPPLHERQAIPNGDGTGFIVVTIPELVSAGALLRQGDHHEWAAACLGANERTRRIIDAKETE
jgi:hypothetical protein